jgi:hypothetical protein
MDLGAGVDIASLFPPISALIWQPAHLHNAVRKLKDIQHKFPK